MLKEHDVAYRYREYTKEPLSVDELTEIVGLLGVEPKALLRSRDKSVKEAGLTGDEDGAVLIAHMSANPGSLQRPIGVKDGKAVIGRPIENLLEL